MWLIRRKRPLGPFYGYAIPTFIRNGAYHLTTVDAYSDGAIDAWGFVDLSLFDGKLKSGWIWPQPPDGGRLGIHNLGGCRSDAGEWLQNSSAVRDQVHEAVRTLNPRMECLVDMQGSDTELRGRAHYAKLGLADDYPCRIEAGGSIIQGREVPAFERGPQAAWLRRIFVFADGFVRIGSQSDLLPLDSICERFGDGQFATSVRDGARVVIEGLGSFTCNDGFWHFKPQERVREIRAMLSELNGGTNPVISCRVAHGVYEQDPSPSNLASLREAYEAVPEHLRVYCGDMDTKDHQIRAILFPAES